MKKNRLNNFFLCEKMKPIKNIILIVIHIIRRNLIGKSRQ
jgi:hypothetical protein